MILSFMVWWYFYRFSKLDLDLSRDTFVYGVAVLL